MPRTTARRAFPARAGLAWIGIVLLAGSCAPKAENAAPPTPRIHARDEIERILVAGGGDLLAPDSSAMATTWRHLVALYERRHYRPLWSDGHAMRRQGGELVEALTALERAGLDPAEYELDRLARLESQSARSSAPATALRPRTLARFDVLATWASLRAAEHLRHGRVPGEALDHDWRRDTLSARDRDRRWRELVRDPSRSLAELEPRHEGYLRLRDALARYREIAAAGGWPPIAPGPALERGARGPRVAALVRRLAASGDLEGPVKDTVYDRRLEQAVGDLQTRLGIPRSGIVGDATREALNVPVARRIRQMELNLERWRWLPDSLGHERVEINLPAYRLELVREGRVARAMRVVVGRRASPTPVFSDQLTYLEVNPTWTVPPSIVVKEIVPALQRRRGYLAANHMRVVSFGGAKRDTVDPATVPWKDAASDSFRWLVIQDAGPDNPLGRIKLMCPNEYDVYLHDTPVRSRFGDAVRDYSHGCVRVEHAVELADSLLAGAPGGPAALDSLVASGTWKRIVLPRPIPVHFLYWTAWADSAQRVCFRDDVYGLDARLDQALRDRAAASFALNPDVTISPFWAAAQARARATAAPGVPARVASTRR